MSVLSASNTDEIVVKSVNEYPARPRRGGRAFALKLLMGVAVAASAPIAADASTYSVIHSFGGKHDGVGPIRGVVYRDGALYGATQQGGRHNLGMVYKFDLATSTQTPLYSFKGDADGQYPGSDLYFIGRTLYGTTYSAGTGGKGTIFRIKPRLAKGHSLYSFQAPPDGGNATGVLPIKGTLYGTLLSGAAGFGAVFKFDPVTRQESIVYSFTGGDDGAVPYGVPVYANGLLFGTTNMHGASNLGTVYSVDPATGAQSTIHAFIGGSDGANPSSRLTYANGLLYGTTNNGGAHGNGVVFSVDPTTGEEVVLHSFDGATEGSWPIAQLTYLDGQLYGTASQGGQFGSGGGERFSRSTPRPARKPRCTHSPARVMAAGPHRRFAHITVRSMGRRT